MKKKLAVAMLALMLTLSACSLGKVSENQEKEVTVAIIDTGLDMGEEIDEARIKWINSNNRDNFGHGTQIASLILNNTGEKVSVMPVKVTNATGMASVQAVCNGIQKAVENGADIINISMNTAFYSDGTELEYLIDKLRRENIYVVVSAGNDRENTKYLSPANIESAIVVSSVDENREPYYFSNYGSTVDFCAYGKYNGKLGSSFAAAYVTSMCANMISCGEKNIESKLVQYAQDIKDSMDKEYYGKGYIGWEGQYVGLSENEEAHAATYVGINNKTRNNLGIEILDMDWESIPSEQLDAVLGETDYKYVGLFLNQLTDIQLKALMEKSNILNTVVSKIDMKCKDNNLLYETNNTCEVKFVDYCLSEYENSKNKMFVTSEWFCKTSDAVFYISSPDRTKIYKYVINGLYDKIWVDSIWGEVFKTQDLNISVSVYKNENSIVEFSMPIPTKIVAYIASVRATKVEAYNYDDMLMWSGLSWNYINENCDDGCAYYGISIAFNNYCNKKAGYHSDVSSIAVYNAEEGVGTSMSTALSYNYQARDYYGQEWIYTEQNFIDFKQLVQGYVKYYYNGIFKPGYNWNNATTFEESLSSYKGGELKSVFFTSGNSAIYDDTGMFDLNINCPPLALGTSWYENSSGALAASSNIPEFHFKLAPNNYTILFNGNGATGGSMANKTMTYDVGTDLPVNGFSRTGYEFAGWNTKADGTGSSYTDKALVKNLTSENNGTIILYAQWKVNYYKVNLVSGYGIGTVSSSGAKQNAEGKYAYGSEVTIRVKELAGFHFINWTGTLGTIGEKTYTFHMPANDMTMTAKGEANSYIIVFHPNEGGKVTPIENITVKYDEMIRLPDGELSYAKYTIDGVNITERVLSGGSTPAYESMFNGWTIESEKNFYVPALRIEENVPVKVIVDSVGMTQQNGGIITLYAIWDDCPWIAADDLYFTLQEAQNGFITYDEVMSYAEAYDREDGSEILPGEDVEKGTLFKLVDYQSEAYAGLITDGSITETYQVIDSGGSVYEKMITVHIVDSEPRIVKPVGTTRFIDEKYYHESYENGGLKDNSVWKTDPEYVDIIRHAFENSRNDTPIIEVYFTQEEIREMKEN